MEVEEDSKRGAGGHTTLGGGGVKRSRGQGKVLGWGDAGGAADAGGAKSDARSEEERGRWCT